MTDTRRSEFASALIRVGMRAQWSPEEMDAQFTEVLRLYDAATAVQGGEPVAWRFPNSTHWRCYKTNPPDEWALISGVEYAYAAAPPVQVKWKSWAVPLPKITDEIRETFDNNEPLIAENCWTQTAVDFAAMLQGSRYNTAPPAARQDAWQPIETAPKVEDEVLGWNGVWIDIIHWDGSGWVDATGDYCLPNPTHWMPLPEPPR